MRHDDAMAALKIERTASEVRCPTRFREISQLARLAFMNESMQRLSNEILDNIHVTPHRTVVTNDDVRTAAALMLIAAEALAWIEILDVLPEDLAPRSCWYCKGSRPSTRDQGLYCSTRRVHKTDDRTCDEFDRRTSDAA